MIPFYPEQDREVTEFTGEDVFEPSSIGPNPIEPNYYFTEYNMANKLTTDISRRAVNWLANMNWAALYCLQQIDLRYILVRMVQSCIR